MTRLSLLLVCVLAAVCHADGLVAGLVKDLASADGAAPAGWQLSSAAGGRATEGAIAPVGPLVAMERQGAKWTANGSTYRADAGKLIAEPAARQFAVASYTVPQGGAGFYAIKDTLCRRAAKPGGRVELRVFVRRAGEDQRPAVYTRLDADESFDFDTFLGYLDAGDTIHIAIGPDGDAAGAATEVDASIVRAPAIPVSDFPGSGWSILRDVPAGSAAARITAWNDVVATPMLQLKAAADRETIAAYRVIHSGYYALHDARVSATGSGVVQAKIYAGGSSSPPRTIAIGQQPTTFGSDIGYVEKGDVISIAFSSGNAAEVAFTGSIVEWAPRTPPLRVERGADGYLDVYDPADPRKAIDIPPADWVTVPAQSEDASEAIRKAFEEARSRQAGQAFAGVRLQRGATYAVAADQVGGDLFALKDLNRIVFDGNGATLNVTSKEFARRGIKLFNVGNCHKLVLADFTTTATSVPFATGEVTAVGPMQGGNQTVTFRLDAGSADPLADIVRTGNTSGYCYDAATPGRLAVGTWTHYPGASKDGEPQIRATDEKGVFTHTVTRTGQSIPVGAKWLVKNKGAGLAYLTTRGGSDDITLWKVTGRASGGGLLYFWQTSRINILDCSFEPAGENWIGSSSDAVHGRGREGVWIENTIIRGVCEDVMNTYGQTMVVTPDDDPNDNVINLRMLIRPSSEAGAQFRVGDTNAENASVGDKLVFFNPRTGHVLGHATVRDMQGGRCTLSTAIPGIDTWEPGDTRNSTVVYNTAAAARFYVRDSRFMDSMRFGIYIKAQGGVMFHNTFDGFSSPPVFVANEPEWPEGPPGTDVWLQGNTFSQNNFGYMSRNRAFTVVDPADISIYTRHLRPPDAPADYTGFITRGQYANSHVKIIGNTFHDWRGTGVSVRNARNVTVDDNLFLPPATDEVMRATLGRDAARGGRFAAIFFDSVSGGSVRGNRFVGLAEGDAGILKDQQVDDLVSADNLASRVDRNGLEVYLPFNEWFGNRYEAAGASKSHAEIQGVKHEAGRLGAGLTFDGQSSRAVLHNSPEVGGKPATQFTVALWLRAEGDSPSPQVLYAQADAKRGVVLAIDKGRLIGGVWQGDKGAWTDLGPAVAGVWQHVALTFDGPAATLRGFVDGLEVASTKESVPARVDPTTADATFGGASTPIRLSAQRTIPADQTAYRGAIDEFHLFSRALPATDVAYLALRRP